MTDVSDTINRFYDIAANCIYQRAIESAYPQMSGIDIEYKRALLEIGLMYGSPNPPSTDFYDSLDRISEMLLSDGFATIFYDEENTGISYSDYFRNTDVDIINSVVEEIALQARDIIISGGAFQDMETYVRSELKNRIGLDYYLTSLCAKLAVPYSYSRSTFDVCAYEVKNAFGNRPLEIKLQDSDKLLKKIKAISQSTSAIISNYIGHDVFVELYDSKSDIISRTNTDWREFKKIVNTNYVNRKDNSKTDVITCDEIPKEKPQIDYNSYLLVFKYKVCLSNFISLTEISNSDPKNGEVRSLSPMLDDLFATFALSSNILTEMIIHDLAQKVGLVREHKLIPRVVVPSLINSMMTLYNHSYKSKTKGIYMRDIKEAINYLQYCREAYIWVKESIAIGCTRTRFQEIYSDKQNGSKKEDWYHTIEILGKLG